jgi:hypothetical protein
MTRNAVTDLSQQNTAARAARIGRAARAEAKSEISRGQISAGDFGLDETRQMVE